MPGVGGAQQHTHDMVWVACTDGLGPLRPPGSCPDLGVMESAERGRGLPVKGKKGLCYREHTPEMKVRRAGRCPESSCESEEGG